MSAIETLNGPALHGRRSAANVSASKATARKGTATAVSDTAVESPAVESPAVVTPLETVTEGTEAAAAKSPLRRVAGAVARVIGVGLLVLGALVFLFLAIGPRVLGYQTSTMLTGSMSPLINPGDVVVTVPTPIQDVKAGDIITYHIPVEDQRVETHRIVEITTTADGGVAVQTKGDANNGLDPWIATLQGKTVDKQVATIPYVGNAIRALREPMVLNTLMYGAPALLVIGMLASIWTKDPSKTAPEGAAQTQAASGE
ncbi:signal peptidase I [Paenarthrobacter sp. JL.01a]|uniref:signal peptidase I n=1 Tax=Paenarthrobacter sp. JL.01a TaxID=2979324 RepID=UPI0021C7299B|nr:signal peptidase I [Paenarthrobacter sp. JL.01a]UXM91514.1 signal peptidase I [Paenarthrobacter sp. JL.01a]